MDELRKAINSCTYTVNRRMLDYFAEKYKNGNYSSIVNVEAESLEFILRELNIISIGEIVQNEPYQWRNDGVYKSFKIDFKRKPANRSNVCIKPIQAHESYNMGELTHIVTFSTNIERALLIGDEMNFNCHRIYTVPEAIKASYSMGNYSLLKS